MKSHLSAFRRWLCCSPPPLPREISSHEIILPCSPPPREISSEEIILPLLPDEVIIEILSWLPVKSLMRFRCVSKSFKSLISSNSDFVKLHLQRSPKHDSVIVTFIDCAYEDERRYAVPCSIRSLVESPSSTIASVSSNIVSLADNQSSTIGQDDFLAWRLTDTNNGTYLVCGSCNGLVCLLQFDWNIIGDFYEYCFYSWNPATRLRSNRSPSLHLPSLYSYCGFGYDESCDIYRVVVTNWELDRMDFKVLNMGDNCWRDMIISCPLVPYAPTCEGQFVNGTLNWLAHKSSSDAAVIFSLDIRKETYQHLPPPDGLDQVDCEPPSLGTLMGCLCLFYVYNNTHFVVWKMNEFGDDTSWAQFINFSYITPQIS